MALPRPASLSPSKLTSFTNCALAFRFVHVDKLPERPTIAATRGTLVHRALEGLMGLPAAERTRVAAESCLRDAHAGYADDPEWVGLGLDTAAEQCLLDDAGVLLDRYFALEDPTKVDPVGVELLLEAEIDGVHLRGIIDRLDTVDGQLVVTDYKTGRSPSDANAKARMLGVHVYALLVERTFGRRPARVQLLHLAEPEAVIATPTDQSTKGVSRKIRAVWDAVDDACSSGDFRPNQGMHCSWCSFQQWCPSFGGDPGRAVVDAAIDAASAAGQDPLLIV